MTRPTRQAAQERAEALWWKPLLGYVPSPEARQELNQGLNLPIQPKEAQEHPRAAYCFPITLAQGQHGLMQVCGAEYAGRHYLCRAYQGAVLLLSAALIRANAPNGPCTIITPRQRRVVGYDLQRLAALAHTVIEPMPVIVRNAPKPSSPEPPAPHTYRVRLDDED